MNGMLMPLRRQRCMSSHILDHNNNRTLTRIAKTSSAENPPKNDRIIPEITPKSKPASGCPRLNSSRRSNIAQVLYCCENL